MGEEVYMLLAHPKQDFINGKADFLEELGERIIEAVDVEYEQPSFYCETADHGLTVTWFSELTIEGHTFSLGLHRSTFDGNVLVHVDVTSSSDFQEIGDTFDNFKISIKKAISQFFRKIYWLKDTHNEKICSSLYGAVHRLENLFRRVISIFMTCHVGPNWVDFVDRQYVKKANEYAHWYRHEYKTYANVEGALFNLQVNDLVLLLQHSYDQYGDKSVATAKMLEEMEKEDIINLLLSKKTLDSIWEYLRTIEAPATLWDKNFAPILGDDFEEKWARFGHMRHVVAHNKLVCGPLYADMVGLMNDLGRQLTRAEEKFEEIMKSEERFEQDRILWVDYEKMLFESAGVDYTPDEEQVWESINGDDSVVDLLHTIEEYVSETAAAVDEILSLIESIAEADVLDDALFNCAKQALCVLGSGVVDNLSDSVSELERLLLNGVEYLSYADSLQTGTLAKLWFPGEPDLELCVDGTLCPERGSSDDLLIRVLENGVENPDCRGFIRKCYADIRLNEHTFVEATNSDDLDVDIQSVFEYVASRAKKAAGFFASVLGKLEELAETLL